MKWFREHWTLVLLVGLLLGLTLFYVRGCSVYKERLAALDSQITDLEKQNTASVQRANEAVIRANEAEKAALEKEAEALREAERRAAVERERNTLRERVAAKTPTEIVARMQEVLVCTEITLTDLGIVLSEACARADLVALEDRAYVIAELESATQQITLHLGEIGDLKNSVLGLKTAIGEKDIQLQNKEAIIKDVQEQLKLEQKYGRSRALKSLAIGGLAGAAIVGVLAVVFGGK